MRSMKIVAMVAVLACAVGVYGDSNIVYTLATGGDNHPTGWENGTPSFTGGVTDGSTTVAFGGDLTWSVRVSTNGLHTGGAGNGLAPLGVANLVFDLEVRDNAGALVSFGAAPMSCTTGTAGVAGALGCRPSAAGFWSSINDGDQDGGALDKLANAAFAVAIYNVDPAPPQMSSLLDSVAFGGPNFDYGWYPTANGRSGIKAIEGGTPTAAAGVATGKLLGFGAGYKTYEHLTHRAGVGMFPLGDFDFGFGADIGNDPLVPAAGTTERPLFEGQISTIGLTPGTYYIKVVPSQTGNNIIHGSVDWASDTPSYGTFGSFAVKANHAVMVTSEASLTNGVPFVVNACTPPATPGAPTVNAPTTSSLNVANNAGDSTSAFFAIRINGGAFTNQFVQADGSVGAAAVWATKATWGTKTVTGLVASTTYTFALEAGTDAAGGCPSVFGAGTSLATAGISGIVAGGRHIFYNQSYYDGNNVALNAGPSATNNHDDDGDAIDPNKTPYFAGTGLRATFVNWTSYNKGINGLIYDIQSPLVTPEPTNFTFTNLGKAGTGATAVASPTRAAGDFVTIVGTGPTPGNGIPVGVTRVVIRFAANLIQQSWLQVAINGASIGVANETHFWGNAFYDTGDASGGNFIFINSTDTGWAVNNPYTALNPRAAVTNIGDFNKDGAVNSTDVGFTVNFPVTTFANAVTRILK